MNSKNISESEVFYWFHIYYWLNKDKILLSLFNLDSDKIKKELEENIKNSNDITKDKIIKYKESTYLLNKYKNNIIDKIYEKYYEYTNNQKNISKLC